MSRSIRWARELDGGVCGVLLCVVLALASSHLAADEPNGTESEAFPLKAKRIVFLGDSNTHAGYYITWIEAQLRADPARQRPELINLGLPSETCSGLSEPDHPFPRPNVHERLDRALQRTSPDVVVVGYGMNDGIYHPFSNVRFAAYKTGIQQIIAKAHAAGAKIVLLTPPAFDPQPMRRDDKLRAADADGFAWFAIYENYDDVLEKYAQWIMSQSDNVEMVIDIHTPLKQHLADVRKTDADYAMSQDGVHFDNDGHVLVAGEILKAWGVVPRNDLDAASLKLVQQRQQLMHNAWLSHVGHQRPGMKAGLPMDKARARAAEIDKTLKRP